MKFHPQKCQVLKITNKKKTIQNTYRIHDTKLEEVTKSKYIGITINNKLMWKDHITNICNKANSTLGFIRRNLYTANKEIKLKCYNSFVRPILEYSSTVWDPHHLNEIHEIESIQKRALKFINGKITYQDSEPLERGNCKFDSGLDTLEDRRKESKIDILLKGIKMTSKSP